MVAKRTIAGDQHLTNSTTSANGCAILAVSPGEYNIYVSKPGYVDPNGYDEHPTKIRARRAACTCRPRTPSRRLQHRARRVNWPSSFSPARSPAEGDSFVAYNTGMTTFRPFPTPFDTAAATAQRSHRPQRSSPSNRSTRSTPAPAKPIAPEREQRVTRSQPKKRKSLQPAAQRPATVRLGPVKIKVMSGKARTHEGLLSQPPPEAPPMAVASSVRL